MFVEYQQNPCDTLRFLEQEPDRLIARFRRTPAALFAWYDCVLDGMRLRLGCNLDVSQSCEIKPTLISPSVVGSGTMMRFLM
jgi:hypothetical protein